MNKIVVTSGGKFSDIDTLASSIAYGEFLSNQGKGDLVVLPGQLNESVTKSIREWDLNYLTELPKGKYSYVLVDISEQKFFADFVEDDKITEIFDHHYGFENYWKAKLGNMSKIEPVGACATLIWEEFEKNQFEISKTSANLLHTAIFANTLNFNSSVTTERDRQAFGSLLKYTSLPYNWTGIYYTELEEGVLNNPFKAIINDTKIISFGNNKKITIGQIELWNSDHFIKNNSIDIKKSLLNFNEPNWFLTSPSISEGKNYIYTDVAEIKSLLIKILDVKFEGDIGTTNKLWLRKEILKKLLQL